MTSLDHLWCESWAKMLGGIFKLYAWQSLRAPPPSALPLKCQKWSYIICTVPLSPNFSLHNQSTLGPEMQKRTNVQTMFM